MSYPCTDDPNEILEYVAAAKTNATKFDAFVNGLPTQTVQLGDGVPTPTIRKFIADAQDVVSTAANEAAETVIDTVADMKLNKADKAVPAVSGNLAKLDETGNIHDSGRAAEDFVLLLAYAHDEALDLALLNRMNVEVYEEWYARGIALLDVANIDAMKTVQCIRDMIDAFDASYAQHRLMTRLFDGTNPGASSKPVLFVVSGQSNAVGYGAYTPFDQAKDCGQFWSWGDSANMLKPIADPMTSVTTKGSGWPAFARRFFELTGRKVILLNIGSGGAAVTDGGSDTYNTWADNEYGTLRTSRQAIWNAFASAVPASSYDVGAILWVQGETEAIRLYSETVTVQDYKDGTIDALGWTRTLIGCADCPVFFGKIGFQSTYFTDSALKNAYKQIQKAEEDMCENESFFMGFSMAPDFALPINSGWFMYMSDSVHYSRLGYTILGNAFARSVVNYLNF